ncbi:hypothetical protein JAAARDRAFT_203329 [Jaapia argillacea MUCL 33604]|uniref:Uncharacterized protein n=1 Tax=Jaapia argillacea MUCL 33604 TaxID=933084 RepID=A0A067Q558_9AGAM|nr:hypothetical protein JAAARDRAFT_203329 [Jaapia argillacea MUCL 33604]
MDDTHEYKPVALTGRNKGLSNSNSLPCVPNPPTCSIVHPYPTIMHILTAPIVLLLTLLATITASEATAIDLTSRQTGCLIVDPIPNSCAIPTCPAGYKLISDFACPVGAMCCPKGVVFKCCPITVPPGAQICGI